MTRPTFDPSVYESPELAEINRPLHDLAWDHIEAQRAYRALSARDRGIRAAHDRVMAAQEAYNRASTEADVKLAAYEAALEAQENVQDEAQDDTQLGLGL